MFSLVFLFAALVSLHCQLHVYAQTDRRVEMDNSLEPNVITKPKHRLGKFVRISQSPPKTVQHAAGSRLELSCEAVGVPAPVIQWLKNGEPLPDLEEETNEIMMSHPSSLGRLTSILILPSVRDGDVYTCLATAGINQDSTSTTVYGGQGGTAADLLQSLYEQSAPRITTYYNELIQEIGSDAVLPCRVRSAAKAQVYWHHNEELVFESPRIRFLPSGDLLVSALRWSDLGVFTCNVDNIYGKDSASTFLYPAKKKQPRLVQ